MSVLNRMCETISNKVERSPWKHAKITFRQVRVQVCTFIVDFSLTQNVIRKMIYKQF